VSYTQPKFFEAPGYSLPIEGHPFGRATGSLNADPVTLKGGKKTFAWRLAKSWAANKARHECDNPDCKGAVECSDPYHLNYEAREAGNTILSLFRNARKTLSFKEAFNACKARARKIFKEITTTERIDNKGREPWMELKPESKTVEKLWQEWMECNVKCAALMISREEGGREGDSPGNIKYLPALPSLPKNGKGIKLQELESGSWGWDALYFRESNKEKAFRVKVHRIIKANKENKKVHGYEADADEFDFSDGYELDPRAEVVADVEEFGEAHKRKQIAELNTAWITNRTEEPEPKE